jgi:hypothetical protein
MPWYAWAMAASLTLDAMVAILAIGRPQKVVQPVDALGRIIVLGLYVAVVVVLAS